MRCKKLQKLDALRTAAELMNQINNSKDINEDYDFYIYGPNATCSNLGQSIRCSTTNPAQANQGNNLTGLNTTSTETSEGPGGNGDSF